MRSITSGLLRLDKYGPTAKALPTSICRCAIAEDSAEQTVERRLLLHGKRTRRYKIYTSRFPEKPRQCVLPPPTFGKKHRRTG